MASCSVKLPFLFLGLLLAEALHQARRVVGVNRLAQPMIDLLVCESLVPCSPQTATRTTPNRPFGKCSLEVAKDLRRAHVLRMWCLRGHLYRVLRTQRTFRVTVGIRPQRPTADVSP